MSNFTGVFVFGDSLVDPGNALEVAQRLDDLPFGDLPNGAPTADRGYFQGRFTDGYNFADLVSNKLLGVPTRATAPYGFELPLVGGTIPFLSKPSGANLSFAYGGAQIRKSDERVPDLDDQTDIYDNYTADPNALYLVTMGGNDVRELAPRGAPTPSATTAAARLSRAADEVQEEVRELYAAGARHVLVTGVPDVGLLPDYNGATNEGELRALATTYSENLETLIQDRLSLLIVPEGGHLFTYSLMQLADQVLADPSAYGFSDVTHARTQVQAGALEPVGSGFLFFDQVHPSAQAHALIAAGLLGALPGGQADVPVERQGTPKWIASVDRGGADAFTASLAAGQSYTFDLLGVSSGSGSLADPVLRVLSASGVVLAEDDDGGLGLDARLSFTAPTSGDYTLQVTGVGAAGGSFALQGEALRGSDVTVQGGPGDDLIAAVAGRNVLRGNDGADSIAGGSGFDDINGNMGADTLSGGGGDDWTVGGKDNDRLLGDDGDDIVYGNLGADTGNGGAGADIVRGGQGDDVLFGGDGDDFLSGDLGDDTISGGAGADLFHTFAEAAIDRVLDFNPADGDRVQVAAGVPWTATQTGGDVTIAMEGGGRLILVGMTLDALTPGWILGS